MLWGKHTEDQGKIHENPKGGGAGRMIKPQTDILLN